MRKKGAYRLLAGLLCVAVILSESSIYTLAASMPIADAMSILRELTTEDSLEEVDFSVEDSSTIVKAQSEESAEMESIVETVDSEEMETTEEPESSEKEITTVVEEISSESLDETVSIEQTTSENDTVVEQETMDEEKYVEAIQEFEMFREAMAVASTEYNLTEEQLFLQCPQYLKTNVVDTYLSRSVGYTVDAMNDVSGTEEVIASFLYGLENGSSFLTKEIAALCGITDSTYTDFKKEMAADLVREYMGTEAYLNDLVSNVGKEFKLVDRFYDMENDLIKAEYIKQLQKASKQISDSEIEKIVNKLFEESDTLMKYAGTGVTVFDMITAIIETQELELTLVDELMICLEDSYDTDLYEGLVMIRNDITDDIVTYIVQNYLVDEAIKYIAGLVTGLLSENISAGLAFAKILATVTSTIYAEFKPSVSDIINTTVLYNYYKTLESSVNKYQKRFYKREGTVEDIAYFKAAYKGQLCAIKLMMQHAKSLTDDKRLKNQLEIYKESIGKEVTCDTYINLCLADASAAIDAGTLVLEESGSIEKTEDGTVLDETYDSTESITAKLNVIMQKYVPDIDQTWTGNWGGAIQCFGFVRMVFYNLYGCNMPSSYYGGKRYEYTSNTNVTLIGQLEGSEVTANNIKNMFTQGHIGDVIQGHGAPYGQHTMMLLGVTDTGIRTYECNYNGECGIYTRTYTWEKLASRYGTGDSNSGNGLSLYHADNYEKIYGNGDDLFYDDSVNFVIQDGVLTKYNGWQSFVTIPEGVTAIGASAFKNNTNMMTVDIPDTVVSIGGSAFYGCSNLLGVVIPDSVTSMGCAAFGGCTKLQSVSLSKNLKSLGGNTFINCTSLIGIEIPKSLESASENWSGTPSNYGSGEFRGCTKLKSISFEEGTTAIAPYLFMNTSGIEKVTIPESVTKIGNSAFYGCSNLVEVIIPNSVTRIDSGAFQICSKLKEINLSDSLTVIESHAFYGCAFESVDIPDSVISMGCAAFGGCTKLESVDLSKNLKSLGGNTFVDCTSLTSIEIPKSLESASTSYSFSPSNDGSGEFRGCTKLKTIHFEEGTTAIVPYLFMYASGIENVVIPEGVTRIGNSAFYECKNLKEIILPDTLTTIENSAFYNCTSLKEVDIPDTVNSMGTYTFYNCTSLEKAHLPEGRINVGEATFYNCSSLTEVNFPKTLNYIRKNAFRGTKISEAILPENIIGIEDNAFYNCDALTKVSIPDKTTSIGSYCFADCELLSDVKLGNGLTTIPTYAFNLCPSLKSIVIPYRVTTINNYAFTNCTELTEITIPRSVTSIGSSVFSYPTKLTIYGLSGTYAETYAGQIGATFVNQEIKATNVTLFSDTYTMNKGAKVRMTVSITPENFTDEVIWRTTDTDIISVDGDGIVTAKALGTAKVQVVVGDVSATCTITVRQPVSSISLNKTSFSLEALETYQLKASISPSDASVKTVTWSSSNDSVAMVDANGIVTALAKGEAIITATAQDGSGVSKNCTVTVLNTCYVCDSPLDMESPHNYESNCSDSWIYTEEGAKQLFVTFDNRTEIEDEFDCLYIYDKNGKQIGKYTGTSLAGKSVEVLGDTVQIKLVSDKVGTKWGFKVTSISQTDEQEPVITTTTSPYANIASGSEVESGTEIILASDTEGATIYYTLDGTDPTIESIMYTAPIVLTEAITIKAIAVKEGYLDSEVATFTYTVAESGKVIYIVTFNSNGGSEVASQTTEENGTIEKPIDPIREGYRFLGWYLGEKIYDFTSPVTANITLDAKWEVDEAVNLGDVLPEDIPEGGIETIPAGLWIAGVDAKGYTYTGKAIKPQVRVYDHKTLLKEKTDYTISYKNNTNAADASSEKAPTITMKGKGNYSGSDTKTFTILKKSLEDVDIRVSDITVNANGKTQKPVPTVTWDGKKLSNKKDFTVSYPELTEANADAYKKVGTYPIEVAGNGNYSGTVTAYIIITDNTLISKASVAKIGNQLYTGSEIKPALTVKYKGQPLTEGTDYTVEYSDNIKVGTATAVVKGMGTFSGEKKVTFKITGYAMKKARIEELAPSVDYTGEERKSAFKVTYTEKGNTRTLTENENFTVSYEKNTNAGTATIVLTGINDFTGTLKKTFKIKAYDIDADTEKKISVILPDEIPYEKGGSKPKPVVAFGDTILTEGKDYTLSYKKNTALNDGSDPDKMPTVTIKGKGNFTKSISEKFCIVQQDISEVKISVPDKVYNQKKNGFKSIPTLVDTNGKKLNVKTDYLKDYVYTYAEETVTEDGVTHQTGEEIGENDVLKVGTLVNVTVTGTKCYTGNITGQYRIIKADIAKTKVTVKSQYYTGKPITLTKEDITVMQGKNEVSKDEFEIVGYENNVKKGTAKVTIKGVGDTYGGTKTVKFTIKSKGFFWGK